MATVSFGVTPGFQEIFLTPGEQYRGTISVVNPTPDSENVVEFQIYATNFFVMGENYENSFDAENDFTQLSKWITFEQTTGVVHGEEVLDIPFIVDVPADAAGGGQYASLIVNLKDKREEMGENDYMIGVRSQVASLLYAAVDGDTRKEGNIVKNSVQAFVLSGEASATSLVKNTGNVHAEAQYFFKVYPLFSDEEIYSNEEQPKSNIVLPGTELAVTNSWEETPQLGVFRVEQTVNFLDNVSTVEKTVFVCPLWFLALWILFIAGGIFWFFTNSRARKKAAKRAKTYSGPQISR